jgi:hypothetical protein
MPVGRPKPKLSPPPWFVLWGLEDVCARGDRPTEERVNVVDVEIGDVAVVAKLAGGRNVRATSEHERHAARATKPPVARIDVVDLAPENIAVPRRRAVEIMNRQDRMGARDVHHPRILPQPGRRPVWPAQECSVSREATARSA